MKNTERFAQVLLKLFAVDGGPGSREQAAVVEDRVELALLDGEISCLVVRHAVAQSTPGRRPCSAVDTE